MANCAKRYTDPSSLRKHVKNHSLKDQAHVKKRQKTFQKQTETAEDSIDSMQATSSTWDIQDPQTIAARRNNIKMDLKNKIMNDKQRKMQQNKFMVVENSNQIQIEILSGLDENLSEFIPYDSIQKLYTNEGDKFGKLNFICASPLGFDRPTKDLS